MRDPHTPVVELSQGASPENPPCPACGEPLFGWAIIRPDGEAVLRCELCGMAVVGDESTREEAATALAAASGSSEPVPNRNSVQAWLGSSGWAGLNRDSRFLFTPDSVERLGYRAARPGPAIVAMWQTLVNSFTFGHNIAVAAFGDGVATPASQPWQRAIDWLIVVATAIPLLLIALAMELPAWLAGRGGQLSVTPPSDLSRPTAGIGGALGKG